MTKKITIQHLYTTGTTATPAASALTLGEIAISAGKGREGIYFKNSSGEIVKVPTNGEMTNILSEHAGDGLVYRANSGESPKIHVSGGTGIAVSADAVSISTDYINKITGATPSSTFNAHTGNTTVHITGDERSNWNTAANRINTFLDVESGATEALDSLHEIQEYLTGSGNSVTTLLESLNKLTDTVGNNTTDITQNTNNISSLAISASTNATKIQNLGQTIGQVTTNVTAINDKIGSGFTSDNTITSEIESIKRTQSNFVTSISGDTKNIQISKDTTNRYAIIHTTAGTQTSEITATNDTTGLSFGSEFKIVDNIGYDANGHVVSGSTQTLKLPILGNAQETVSLDQLGKAGIVRIVGYETEYDVYGLNNFPTSGGAPLAVGIKHQHSNYATKADLGMTFDNGITIISCGTY